MDLHLKESHTGWLRAFVLVGILLLAGCETPPTTRRRAWIPPPPPPIVAVEGINYTVRQGDTVYSIADEFGINWGDLLEANPAMDPRKLAGGTVIVIPTGKTKPDGPTKPAAPEIAPNPGHPGPIAAEAKMIWPVRGVILCKFNQPASWRKGEPNKGIDIRAEENEIVVAAKSGKVSTWEKVDGYGKVVVLEHTDGTITFYGHNSWLLVKHGTWVKQGERIAVAGSTGRSSGIEVYFRFIRKGNPVDPLPLLRK